MGPTEQSAMSPKLFSLAFLPPMVMAIPTPRAIMNGTVMGPVVTPPESNDSASIDPRPACSSSATPQKIIMYRNISMDGSSRCRMIL